MDDKDVLSEYLKQSNPKREYIESHPDNCLDNTESINKEEVIDKCNIYTSGKDYEKNVEDTTDELNNLDDNKLFRKMFREATGSEPSDEDLNNFITDDGEKVSKDANIITEDLFDERIEEIDRRESNPVYKTGYLDWEDEDGDYRFRYMEPIYLGSTKHKKLKLYRIAPRRIYSDLNQHLIDSTYNYFDIINKAMYDTYSLDSSMPRNVHFIRLMNKYKVEYDHLIFSRLMILLAYPYRLNPVVVSLVLACKCKEVDMKDLPLDLTESELKHLSVFKLRKKIYSRFKDVMLEVDFLLDMFSLELNLLEQISKSVTDRLIN